MDPIGAITSITAGVLRRIADAIEDQAPSVDLAQPIVVHIASVTITETATRPTLFGRKKE
ncbi:hypothetical protein ACFWQG_13125 [Rhodococcus sp. NPDC058532]|uniref:hypothetical protein n=1 Tax=Rhodococcus sp. NPDC058532 TaxID=3346540 RepID=UPI0036677E63